ncbi:MAG: DUF2264 domain-containing protein [Opitutae bacterium]|nr:DUF2264 domain-containing protein [Opitutae bacterium]
MNNFRKWQNRARRLLEPLRDLMEEGRAQIGIEGKASDHDSNADRLESVGRPLLLFAHWRYSLNAKAERSDRDLSEPMEAWFRQALLSGTDPKSREFWGWSSNFHQHSVEMGLLIIALEISRDWLWDRYSEDQRRQILRWLESDAGNGHHWNNHMFFGIFVMEFLLREGRGFPAYRAVIDRWFEELESMYLGDGWYRDGMNQSVDFYNAYAWHYYGLWWIRLYGQGDPDRCERWIRRTRAFLPNYTRFFSAQGEHPPFGRSITYRFNATAPFGMAQLMGFSPVKPGLAREICQRNLDFFLRKPIFQEQGCLSMGWHDSFEDMVETYTCAGSPYWAAKAFAPLLLPLDDPFWSAPPEPLPAEEGDVSVALPAPGLIVRSVGGEVEIINAGSQIASCNIRFGTWKWGKLSYRTDLGFLISRHTHRYPPDAGLTAFFGDGEECLISGRHSTTPVKVDKEGMACLYSLGDKSAQSQVSVETRMWWKAGWQLILHRYISHQECILRHGSHSLSSRGPNAFREFGNGDDHVGVRTEESGVALQALSGDVVSGSYDRPNQAAGPREHIQAPYHAVRLMERKVGCGSGHLACLSWAGRKWEEAAPWIVKSLACGSWKFEHPALGEWTIEDDNLPRISAPGRAN